jgi:hypothetical protein
MLEAYCDGAYFLMNEEAAGVRRIYSQMTADDAKALIYEKNFDNEIIFNGQKAEYVKNSDGSYVVTVSELSESDVAKLNENLGTATASGQGRIKDVVTTINADILYNIHSINIEMIFEEDDAFNVEMSYFIEYTKLGTAKKDTTRLDKSKYTEVPDIRALYEIEDMLLDRLEEEVVNCDYSATAEITVNGMMETAREEDSITYRNAKNGFTYIIKGKVNGQRYEVSYANGIQSNYNSRGALVAKDSVSESVAKQYIYDYVINSAGYSSETVTDLSVRDLAGTKMYIIDCYVRDIGSLAQGFEALGGECERATLRITMYVSDGKITKTEALMAAFGEVSLGYNSTYDVRMVHKSELVYND